MYCENNGREYAYDPLYNNPNSSQENAPYKQPPKESTYNYSYTNKKFPKCTCCGYVGEWKVEPLFRPIDWAIGIIGGIVTLGFGF